MSNTAVAAPAVGHARIRPWLVVGLWTFYAVMSINQSILWAQVNDRTPNYKTIFGYSVSLCAVWLCFTPLIIWATRRFALGQPRWRRNLLAHVPLMLGLAVLAVFIDRQLAPILEFVRGPKFWGQYLSALDMNLFYYIIIVASVTAADFFHLYRERQRKAAELQTELVTAKLETLKMQLQPHFLFNTLNTINALIHEDAEAADRMVTRLADLLRLTLYESRQEVPLARELEFVSAYVDIQQIRFHNRLTVTFEVRGALLGARVPSLVLQPLVENAIRHGIAPRARPGNVWVRAQRVADQLILEVEDDGVGLPADGNLMVRGIGLANTRTRLQELYGSAQEFHIRSAGRSGTLVRMALPFAEAAEPAPDIPSEAIVSQLA